ncbi:unnamed protein product [Moneuplotes crassus]|uniref:Uncharacterized protein n=1 Tax=Euplotes crassus TaxID=5936 RepID=A0AAD1Y1L2_EUPCR|nr:unnamed protein product [Moneuplotes crassus]
MILCGAIFEWLSFSEEFLNKLASFAKKKCSSQTRTAVKTFDRVPKIRELNKFKKDAQFSALQRTQKLGLGFSRKGFRAMRNKLGLHICTSNDTSSMPMNKSLAENSFSKFVINSPLSDPRTPQLYCINSKVKKQSPNKTTPIVHFTKRQLKFRRGQKCPKFYLDGHKNLLIQRPFEPPRMKRSPPINSPTNIPGPKHLKTSQEVLKSHSKYHQHHPKNPENKPKSKPPKIIPLKNIRINPPRKPQDIELLSPEILLFSNPAVSNTDSSTETYECKDDSEEAEGEDESNRIIPTKAHKKKNRITFSKEVIQLNGTGERNKAEMSHYSYGFDKIFTAIKLPTQNHCSKRDYKTEIKHKLFLRKRAKKKLKYL